MIRQSALFCMCLALLAGCVNFQYDGETEAPGPEEVAVFRQASGIRRPYRVFGRATVSGDYQDVSRDRLLAKLKSEAKEKGADAILITEQQVVLESEAHGVEPRFGATADYDNGTGSMQQILRDMDLGYGCYRDSMEQIKPNVRYLRVLRAEFLKYTKEKPKPLEVIEPTSSK